MDEICKEVKQWHIEISTEDEDVFYFKGHNLSQEKVSHYLKEELGMDGNKTFKETYAHWVMVTYDGERQRWLLPDSKYKGVRGGFKITEVEFIS